MTFGLQFKKEENIIYLTSPRLLEERSILIAFTTRQGGISAPPYHALNLAFHVGDVSEKVVTNRSQLCKILGVSLETFTTAEQIHGDSVVKVDKNLVGKGALSYQDAISGADALITHLRGVSLALFFADCVSVIIVDRVKRVVAVIHAGWKGIYLRIVSKTVRELVANYSSSTSDLLAFLGPHINKECYQVSRDLYYQFRKEFPRHVEKNRAKKERGKGFRLDLAKIIRDELKSEGLHERNIFSTNICTACRSDLFFSYRAEGGKTGRQGAIVVLL